MELVYLWVEEYKNIHKQGFNFSSKYNCEFKDEYDEDGKLKDNCKLIIKENDNYIENFFGDNINITAIVGKNGSGKSNILEFVIEQNKYYGIYIFYHKSKVFIYDNITTLENHNIHSNISYKRNDIYTPPYGALLNIKSYIDINTYSIGSQLTMSKTFFKFSEKRDYLSELHKNNVELFNIFRINSSNESSDIMLMQHFEYLKSRYLHMIIKYYSKLKEFIFNYFKIDKIEFKIKSLGEIFFASPKFKDNYINDSFLNKIYTNYNRISNKNKIISLYVLFTYLNENEKKDFILDKFRTHSIEDIYLDIQKEFNSDIDILWNTFIDSIDVQDNIETIISAYIELSNKIPYEILEFSFLPTLSSGEEKLLYILINIYDSIIKYKNIGVKSYTILLDEPDTFLHPNWQKKLIEILINFLNNLFDDKFQIILTTHSPFLISDIPKENIIFLDKDENGNCKVVDGLKEKKQTFGANIHTLLSDSFFMENGLMGEFAKAKINEVINFHKKVLDKKENSDFEELKKTYEENKTKFWQIQSIIGEDYLKQVIKNHLQDIESILLGKSKAKEEEIKRVQLYLDSLKND